MCASDLRSDGVGSASQETPTLGPLPVTGHPQAQGGRAWAGSEAGRLDLLLALLCSRGMAGQPWASGRALPWEPAPGSSGHKSASRELSRHEAHPPPEQVTSCAQETPGGDRHPQL